MLIPITPNCLIYLCSGTDDSIWCLSKRPLSLHSASAPFLRATEDTLPPGAMIQPQHWKGEQRLEDWDGHVGYPAKAILTKQKNKTGRETILLETELVRGHFQGLWMRMATQEQKILKDKISIPYHVSKNTCISSSCKCHRYGLWGGNYWLKSMWGWKDMCGPVWHFTHSDHVHLSPRNGTVYSMHGSTARMVTPT